MHNPMDFTWRALNAALSAAMAAALVLGASLAWIDGAREAERQLQLIRDFAAANVEFGRGNPKRLQAVLASWPGSPLLAGLEIQGKSGTLAAVGYEDGLPGWLGRLLPVSGAAPREFPLDERGTLVLKVTVAPAYYRVLQAMPPALAMAGFVLVIANVAAWLLRGRLHRGGMAGGRCADALAAAPLDRPRSRADAGQTSDPLDDLPVAALRCDAEGQVAYMNEAASALLGRRPDEIHPLTLLELIAPWERAAFSEVLASEFRPGFAATAETQMLAVRGGILPVTIGIVRTAGGGRFIVFRDASAERALREELTVRTLLFDALPFGVAMLKRQSRGEILYSNHVFRALLQLPDSSGDFPSRLVDHVAAGLAASDAQRLRTLIDEASVSTMQCDWQARDEGSRVLELQLFPVTVSHAADTLLVCVVHDRTEEIAFRQNLEQELTRGRRILDEMPLGLCIAEENGRVRAANAALGKLADRRPEQFVNLPIADWLCCDSQQRISRGIYGLKGTDRVAALSTLVLPTSNDGDEWVYFLDDITSLKKQADADHAELERLQLTLDGLAEGVITTNAGAFIQYMNPHGQRLTGLAEHQYKGMLLGQVIHLVDEMKREPIADPAVRAMRVGKTVKFRHEIVLVRENRHELAVEVAATPLQDAKHQVVGCVILLKDVSEQRSLTRQMAIRATRDPLTGLINRRELLSLLEAIQGEVEEHHRQVWLCYMDLDRFKIVNDSCGHNAGDELLRQIAQLMQECLRANDILARIGGDEFCVVLCDTSRENAIVAAEKIREAVKHFRFAWDGKYFEVGVSIGVFGLLEGLSVDEAIAAADQACYVAKEKGRDLVYAASLPQYIPGKALPADWSERLSKAMEHDYFRLYRQDAQFLQQGCGEATAYHEILPQLQEPGEAPIVAAGFLPRAQRLNLVPAIERSIIGKLFSLIPPGNSSAADVYAIQLSSATLAEAGLPRFLSTQSDLYKVSPHRICFEISEDDVVANFSLFQKFMWECGGLGYRFCLSHFGGGISSFGYVRNLPLAFLKIDSSLTRRVESDPVDEEIIRAIQKIGERLRILIIAQNVESQAAADRLRGLGIHYIAGPVVAMPVPLEGDSDSAEAARQPHQAFLP